MVRRLSLFSQNGWESIVFVNKWLGVCRFFHKMGGSRSFFSKNEWEWVVFLEKWVGVGESGWEWLGAQLDRPVINEHVVMRKSCSDNFSICMFVYIFIYLYLFAYLR